MEENLKLSEVSRTDELTGIFNRRGFIINYRRFKGMCESSVYDKETTTNFDMKEILELMQGSFRNVDLEVVSIKDKVVRTKMIMEHIDTMLEIFRVQCEKSSNPEDARQFRVIQGLYLDPEPKKARDIAEEECITISTVYRDADKAFRRLAVLFFGIDGVKF